MQRDVLNAPQQKILREINDILREQGHELHGQQERVILGVLFKAIYEVGATHTFSRRVLREIDSERAKHFKEDGIHYNFRTIAETLKKDGSFTQEEESKKYDDLEVTNRAYFVTKNYL